MQKLQITPLAFVFCLICTVQLFAQDVIIDVPTDVLINRREHIVEKWVMNTQQNTKFGSLKPTIRAQTEEVFRQPLTSYTLSSELLQWQLASIGGKRNPLSGNGVWPMYKWFVLREQTWYEPGTRTTFPAGDVIFSFKMPSDMIKKSSFRAGLYSMQVIQNYGASSGSSVRFTPETMKITLSIPPFVSWISTHAGIIKNISSLDEYRRGAAEVQIDLGNREIAHTVNFKLWTKSASSGLQYTSTKSNTTSKLLPAITMKSTAAGTTPQPLSGTRKDLTNNNGFEVAPGNRQSIPLTATISSADFKKHFFEAGTYQFQVAFEAENTENSIIENQTTEVTIKVPPLAEISILAAAANVNFDFKTAEQYEKGEVKVAPKQVRVSNNETYELYVKADRPFFNNSSSMSADILDIAIAGESRSVSLSTVPQKVLSNGTPVLDKDLDIQYSISASNARKLLSQEKKSYSINIIYSFTAL